MTAVQVAELLSVSPQRVCSLKREGRLEAVAISRTEFGFTAGGEEEGPEVKGSCTGYRLKQSKEYSARVNYFVDFFQIRSFR